MEIIDYGVCRLALVPVRKAPDIRGEQINQLLFGDHYEVIQTTSDKKWIAVRLHADLFEGWIDIRQHHAITKDYFDQISYANFKITTDVTCNILYKKSPLVILMGSIVPISNSELFKIEEQFAFNGEAKSLGQKRDFEFLRSIAQKYLHAPYQPGGKSPFGIDPAGFTQIVFKISGYSLQRELTQQANQGKKVAAYADAKPGDLAYFHDENGIVNHVGIVFPGEKIMHVQGQVRMDHFLEDGILHAETKIFTHPLAGIRRVITHPELTLG